MIGLVVVFAFCAGICVALHFHAVAEQAGRDIAAGLADIDAARQPPLGHALCVELADPIRVPDADDPGITRRDLREATKRLTGDGADEWIRAGAGR